jgi:pantothenate kinase type III
MIDGMVKRIKQETKKSDLKVIITGGHSKIVYPYLDEEITKDESLILKGLLIILSKNIKSN